MALLAPRIGNDVSYVTQISADIHFVWQAQHFVTFWEIAKCCILQYKIVSKMGRVRSPKRRVRDDDFVFGLSSDIVGYPRIVFLSAEAFREFLLKS